MTTIDQITQNAIAAGRRAVEEFWSTPGPPEDQGKPFSQAEIDLIFIRAYEAAMWVKGRPPEDGGENYLCDPSYRRCERYRPLPQPPEVA